MPHVHLFHVLHHFGMSIYMVVEVNQLDSSITIAKFWSRRQQQVSTFKDGSRVGSMNSTESFVFNANIRNKLNKV